MTLANELYHEDCDKIPAECVDAYFDLSLNPEDPSELIFDNSWGTWRLDLTPAVKDAETITSLEITNEDDVPTYLQFNREDGGADCIHGDDLSRIISMIYLKDVDQNTRPVNGDVYMYNDGKFYTYNLQTFINNTNSRLNSLENRMTAAENAINNLSALIAALTNRVSYLEEITRRPDGVPTDTRIAYANRNIYSDYTNTNKRDYGVFTHSTSDTLNDDMYFS